MSKEFLWVRFGDAGSYEKGGSVEDLDEILAGEFNITNEIVRYGRYGITDNDKFKGLNYISLFYGDEDAQPTIPVSREELADLNERIRVWHKEN